ncbi:hypothetical protein P4631_07370 [Halalkalibacterium halodurans]|uniref:hypothetical protein n=1 Tax=Halalkalibacterium halodurans TaxID=86665 RepID=UPI002E1BF8E7|nr:hypothetical protein [Halalkalibacterium halodurans]MED4172270.1 hypothetical protein [Halalkalibacterium halodurans]
MKHIFAFERKEEYEKHQDTIQRFKKKLKEYQQILESEYALRDLPKGIIWTNEELATTVFSEIPIPAYTNNNLIYMSPDIETWRNILVKTLDGNELPYVQRFYENFSDNQVFIILAHELTHHSDLFLDEFEDERVDSIWFEEGMCFYLPRKLLLSEEEFNDVTFVEMKLVEAFKDKYGEHSIDDFGIMSYQGNLTSIMFDYWRSYLAVKHLVEVQANHNVNDVFKEYHNWHKEGRKVPLSQYFGINSFC